MKFSLIKQMNESIREKDDYEKALAEGGFDSNIDDIDQENPGMDFDMGDGDEATLDYGSDGDEFSGEDMEGDVDSAIRDFVTSIKSGDDGMTQGTADEMSDDQIRDQAVEFVENMPGLEFEDHEEIISRIMSELGRGEVDTEVQSTNDEIARRMSGQEGR